TTSTISRAAIARRLNSFAAAFASASCTIPDLHGGEEGNEGNEDNGVEASEGAHLRGGEERLPCQGEASDRQESEPREAGHALRNRRPRLVPHRARAEERGDGARGVHREERRLQEELQHLGPGSRCHPARRAPRTRSR